MMGQTIVRARELRREDLLTAAVHDHLAQQAQSTTAGATSPWQVLPPAIRERCTAALDILAARVGCALRWRGTPRDHTARVVAR